MDETVTIAKDADDGVIYIVQGPSLANPEVTASYALRKASLAAYAERLQFTMLAQFAKLVGDGLILSKHCFHGLRRNLYCDDNENGHDVKYALVRRPAYDYVWVGGAQGKVERKDAPADRVLVVLISENTHRDAYPEIEGWIDRWSWVAQDKGQLAEAPDGWVERYERKVWSTV